MAKLVAALCPKCGANVQIDPLREYITCTYCGTSSFVQTDRRPVTQQIAQAQYPVIRVPTASVGKALLVLLIAGAGVVALMLGGLVVFLVSAPASSPQSARLTTGPTAQAAPLVAPALPAHASLPNDDFFKDATPLPAKLSAAIGTPLKALEMVIYPEYATIRAQDPKNPAHVDDYFFRNGEVQAPTPVAMSDSNKRQLDAQLFDLAGLDFSAVPKMIADALKAIAAEDGKATHIILEMSHKEPRFRVYVSSQRDSGGYVEYSPKGERRMVMK